MSVVMLMLCTCVDVGLTKPQMLHHIFIILMISGGARPENQGGPALVIEVLS